MSVDAEVVKTPVADIDVVPEEALLTDQNGLSEDITTPASKSYVPSTEEVGAWPRTKDMDEWQPVPLRETIWKNTKRATAAGVMSYVALTGTRAFLEHGPGTEFSVAGLQTTTHPRLGWEFSEVDMGLGGSAEGHPHMHFADANIGFKVSTDGSKLHLHDPDTRAKVSEVLSHPDPEIDRAKKEFELSLLERGLEGLGASLVLVLGSRGLWRALDKHQFKATNLNPGQERLNRILQRNGRGIAAVVIGGCAIYDGSAFLTPHNPTIVADPSLDGTHAEGWQTNGVGTDVLSLFKVGQPNEQLTQTMSANLIAFIEAHPELKAEAGWTTEVRGEDVQDKESTARLIGTTTKYTGASIQILTGDIADQNGDPSFILDSSRYASGHASTILVKGNHDGAATEKSAKLSGVRLGDFLIKSLNSNVMLFVPSVYVSVANGDAVGSVLRNPNLDMEASVKKVVGMMCQNHVDFVYLHDHLEGIQIAQEAIKAGCAPRVVYDGRSYPEIGPHVVKVPGYPQTTVEDTIGSGGGYTPYITPGPGPIESNAYEEVEKTNTTTHEVKLEVITIHPDGMITGPDHMKTIVPPDAPPLSANGDPHKHIAALDLDKNKVYVKKQQ